MLAVYERYRLSPITLAAEKPIAQLEVSLFPSDPLFFQPVYHGLFRIFDLHSVQETGIHENSALAVGICFFRDISSCHYFDDRKSHLLCKLIVPCIMSRNCHYGACSISHQYIV